MRNPPGHRSEQQLLENGRYTESIGFYGTIAVSPADESTKDEVVPPWPLLEVDIVAKALSDILQNTRKRDDNPVIF